MNPRTPYQQIQRATFQLAVLTCALLMSTVICALLGSRQGVISLKGATTAAVYAFGVVFLVWAVASVFRVVGQSLKRPVKTA